MTGENQNKNVLRVLSDGALQFQCPGCGLHHFVYHQASTNPNIKSHPIWDWNGKLDKPTISPSILVSRPYFGCTQDLVCHSFVTDGQIRFLSDCTHQLAGKTVDLEPWPSAPQVEDIDP